MGSQNYILPLRDANFSNIALVGGKAASLGELITAGLHVPDGFVITTNAYNAQNDVSIIIAEAERTFDSLSLDRVAVRSSAVGEDAGDSSWAGQLDTVLNVTREGLKDAIEHCWQSMQSSRAQAYAKDNNISKDEQSVAVVIQKMVDADVAGVAFTVNPVNGDQNQLIIEAIYGLGELLVQGSVTPEGLVIYRKSGQIIDRSEHRQVRQLAHKNGENVEIPVRGKGPILSDMMIKALLQQCTRIEDYYGKPQDIEFAFEDSDLFIVQSRPISTLNNGGL